VKRETVTPFWWALKTLFKVGACLPASLPAGCRLASCWPPACCRQGARGREQGTSATSVVDVG
jgi:hypothetical protein